MNRRSGFTLIELSIVLVIVGLVAGGILLGHDLIASASIRAQVSQIEKYRTSMNTFRVKYAYLPGDMPSSRAAQLGFFAETTLGGTPGHQDGNGFFSGAVACGYENFGFWRHLTDAQMIDGNYGTATSGNPLIAATGIITNDAIAGTIGQVFPPAEIGRGNFISVGSSAGSNYFLLMGIPSISSADGSCGFAELLTPREAYEIDSKLDDGRAQSGRVRPFTGALCGSNYVINQTSGNVPSCFLFLLLI